MDFPRLPDENLEQLNRIVAGEEPPPWWVQAISAPPALTYRQQVSLRVIEDVMDASWEEPSSGAEDRGHLIRRIAKDVRDLTDTVCAAMEDRRGPEI